jgi:hypothetical protein
MSLYVDRRNTDWTVEDELRFVSGLSGPALKGYIEALRYPASQWTDEEMVRIRQHALACRG